MSVPLFDGFGRPVEYWGGGQELYQSPQDDGLRLPRPNLNQDIATLLSREKHRTLISDARYIASTFPLVGGAVQQKSHYVCQAGFAPHFFGADRAWGRRARELLIECHKVVNVRGALFDWDRSWKIGCTAIDIDGDFFVVLGETAEGYPQVQFLESHRVGSRHGERVVSEGPYRGLRILNGIVYNGHGHAVAFNVLGNTPAEDRQISALDMFQVAIPRWFSDGRPFPLVAYSILDWYDVKETRGFQKTKAKANAAIVMTEETPDGGAPANSMAEALRKQRAAATAAGDTAKAKSSALTDPIVQVLAGGLIRYVKSGTGGLKVHQDNTPADSAQRFDDTVVSGAFYGMDWRVEMMNLAKLSGGAIRGFADQINTTIYERWLGYHRFPLKTDFYLIRKFVKRGDLPENPDWWKWGYPPPADFTADQGRSSKADIDNVRAGIESIPAIVGRYGRTAEEVMIETAQYLRRQREIAEEYDVEASQLGTLAQPGLTPEVASAIDPAKDDDTKKAPADGDDPAAGGGARDPETPPDETDDPIAAATAAKLRLDAIGVAVRAGSLTPSPELEDEVRRLLSLEAMPASVREAWQADGNVRLPVTLASGDGAAPPPPDPESEN